MMVVPQEAAKADKVRKQREKQRFSSTFLSRSAKFEFDDADEDLNDPNRFELSRKRKREDEASEERLVRAKIDRPVERSTVKRTASGRTRQDEVELYDSDVDEDVESPPRTTTTTTTTSSARIRKGIVLSDDEDE
jgi:hypothetical protein